MITIHYDFTDGTEVSRGEGLQLGDNFTTNCLTFFNNDYDYDCKIVCKDGRYILMSELYTDANKIYTDREIRETHNILKIFIANGFNWKQPEPKKIKSIVEVIDIYLIELVGTVLGCNVVHGNYNKDDKLMLDEVEVHISNNKVFNDCINGISNLLGCQLGLTLESDKLPIIKGTRLYTYEEIK